MTPKDFKWYVAITQQDTVAVIAICPKCGMSTTFQVDNGGSQIAYSLQSHQCYQTIVSEPK